MKRFGTVMAMETITSTERQCPLKREWQTFSSVALTFIHTRYFDNEIAILAVKKYFLRLLSHSPTVSHTLPAGGVHPLPPLETSI